MEQWRIHKDRAVCDKPSCPLAGEQEYYAILQLPECLRVERCHSCFEELKQTAAELPFHWKMRRTFDGKQKAVLDLESLRSLFDRLGEELETAPHRDSADDTEATAPEAAAPEATAAEVSAEDGERVEGEDEAEKVRDYDTAAGLRYLVALLLVRKRRLKMVDPKNAEQEKADLLVVDPKVEDMVPVMLSAPDLGPERLDSLREELMVAIGEEPETEAAT